MIQGADLASITALIGDPSRASILFALLGGEALPATELARRAHVTPQTTSAHLARLLHGNLIKVTKIGRHRYYSLKNDEVAQMLEVLQRMAPPSKSVLTGKYNVPQDLCHARTCYDHLAGKLGVAFTNALVAQAYMVQAEEDYLVTPKGIDLLERWQIDVEALKQQRRKFAYACLDWSERRFHLAGSLGAAITQVFFENGWIKRMPQSRALNITRIGEQVLKQDFNIDLPDAAFMSSAVKK